jgi:hypothetical protein
VRDEIHITKEKDMKRSIIATAVLATSLFGVGIAVGEIGGIPGSSAATVATPTTSQTITKGPSFPDHGSAAHENAEKAVTGTAATQAQAAAVKSVGSGTAGAVTADIRGKGYEVTVTKSDGSTTDVHLDSGFTVEAGHGGDGDGDGGSADSAPGA